jgi:hypothetical protein
MSEITADQALTELLHRRADAAVPRPGFRYSCIEAFLLAHAKFYRPPRFGVQFAAPGDYFDGAYRLAQQDRLHYYEGMVLAFPPALHAWCVTKDGQVVEPTFGMGAHSYFGLEIPLELVRQIREAGGESVLADERLLRGEWDLMLGGKRE